MKSITIASAAAWLLPVACYAMLGAAPSASPGVRLASPTSRSAASAAAAAPYSVHASQAADGVTIREYASADNVVFAVTWQGPTRPDMQTLLGSYFPNFVAAGQRRPRGTGPLIGREGELHIESLGRPGMFAGKAYVPRLVPASVNMEVLP
jgi:hypothetical protein